ncbi:MAG: thioredoxin family protein [Flavobacteriaceae bacterium]|nr:thioredoxin family protein [Flavobacteriaceae bacterium]
MKSLKFLIVFLMLSVSYLSSAQKIKEIASPQLIVVKFHADWCRICRVMGPVFEDLQNKMDGKNVLFIKLDFTNNQTKHQAQMLGDALGITPVLKKNYRRTGFILIIDPKTKKVLQKLTKDDDVYAMEAKVKSYL